MKRGRAAARARRRALAVALALAVASAAVAPVAPGPANVARAQGGTGIIAHSSKGVLLRAEPDYGAEVLATVAEGTAVGLRTDVADTVYDPDGVTQWWPISAGDADGWVAGFYLDIEGFSASPAAEPAADSLRAPVAGVSLGGEGATATEEQFLATWDLANAAALVAEPDGVNLRQDPGSSSPAVKTLSYQTVVELRVDEVDTVYTEGSRWWPVQIDGLVGWVAGQYLAPAESTWTEPEVAADAAVSEAPSKVADWFEAGSYVLADTDDGSGLNIRADGAPDAERIGIVPENDVVQVMDGPYNDPIGNPWYLITDGDVTGFVSGWYLSRADQPGEDLAQTEIPSKVTIPGVATGAVRLPTRNPGSSRSRSVAAPIGSSPGIRRSAAISTTASTWRRMPTRRLLAADGGIVEYAGWCDCGLGYYVKIDHGNGFKTLYGHMAEQPWVSAGEAVAKGDVIGPVGSTGASTGPHVHFIVELNGVDQDPLAYLPY